MVFLYISSTLEAASFIIYSTTETEVELYACQVSQSVKSVSLANKTIFYMKASTSFPELSRLWCIRPSILQSCLRTHLHLLKKKKYFCSQQNGLLLYNIRCLCALINLHHIFVADFKEVQGLQKGTVEIMYNLCIICRP